MKIIYLLLTTISFLCINKLSAQEQWPVTPGKYKNSFVLSWEKSDTISKYEYVVSDNPECFGGCAGDTKSATVFGNEVTVFPLFENKTYYWKVRPINEGDSTLYWSSILTFETIYPEEPFATALATIFPIPNYSDQLTIRIDNSILQNNETLKAIVYDSKGNIAVEYYIPKTIIESRFNDTLIPIESLNAGHYSLSIVSDIRGKVQQLKFFKP